MKKILIAIVGVGLITAMSSQNSFADNFTVELHPGQTPDSIVTTTKEEVIDYKEEKYTSYLDADRSCTGMANSVGRHCRPAHWSPYTRKIKVPVCNVANPKEILIAKVTYLSVQCANFTVCDQVREVEYCKRDVKVTRTHNFNITNLNPIAGESITISNDSVTNYSPEYIQKVIAKTIRTETSTIDTANIILNHNVLIMTPEYASELRTIKSLTVEKGSVIVTASPEAYKLKAFVIGNNIIQKRALLSDKLVSAKVLPMNGPNGRNIYDAKSIFKKNKKYIVLAGIGIDPTYKVISEKTDPALEQEPVSYEFTY